MKKLISLAILVLAVIAGLMAFLHLAVPSHECEDHEGKCEKVEMKGHCDKSDAGCEGKGHCEGKMDCKGEEGCPEMGSCCMMMMHGGACPMMMEGHPGCGEGAGMIGGHGDSVMKNIEVKVTVNGDSAMKGNPHGMMMGGGCCCMKMMMMHHSCMKKEGCEGKAEGCGKKESCKGEMHGKKECCDKK